MVPARDGSTKASAGFAVGFFPSSTSAKPFTKAVASWGCDFHRSNFLQAVPGKAEGDPGIILSAASHSQGTNGTRGEPHVHPEAGAQPRACPQSPPPLAKGARGVGKHDGNGAAWLPREMSLPGWMLRLVLPSWCPPSCRSPPGAAGLPARVSAEQPAGTCGFVFDRESQDNSVVVALL